ncbi:MAG: AAA family ATPase, partial [Deltaproteobacteria bacterium]|nr:AAA family ATPase [Deltaproteobacteria bacterium]
MRVEQIKIKNFRGISEMDLVFDQSLNVFSGVNGAGKSTILDALATMLSWVPARIRRLNAPGRQIGELDIKSGTSSS